MSHIIAVFMKQLTSLIKVPIMIGMSMFYLGLAVLIVVFAGEDPSCYTCVPAYICYECIAAAAFELPESPTAQILAMAMGLSITMYAAGLVNEDRLTGNLKFMSMAEVNPWQYMAGTFMSVLLIASAIVVPYAFLGVFSEGMNPLWFMIVGLSGAVVAVLLGVTIGMYGNPLVSIIAPFCLGFLPMFSQFNDNVANLSRFVFVQQINVAIADLGADLTESFIIIGANGAIFFLLFVLIHRKNKLIV